VLEALAVGRRGHIEQDFQEGGRSRYKETGVGREFSLEGVLKSYTERPNINLTH
jgi:hypothetical protein